VRDHHEQKPVPLYVSEGLAERSSASAAVMSQLLRGLRPAVFIYPTVPGGAMVKRS
jgi:hypothetical protein